MTAIATGAQLSELLDLIKQSDSVELKLTVPDTDLRSTVVALGMDALEALLIVFKKIMRFFQLIAAHAFHDRIRAFYPGMENPPLGHQLHNPDGFCRPMFFHSPIADVSNASQLRQFYVQ